MTPKILVVFGTRPEAIKMVPVVEALRQQPSLETRVCVTGQHRGMLDQVLQIFGVTPDHDLDVMLPNQTLATLTSRILPLLDEVLATWQPDLVVVHGDTTTSFVACLAAYYRRIAVAHVEAGLRTGNLYSPWPEEGNRRLTGALAALHFAPTQRARQHLLAENVADAGIAVVGNTVIDAVLLVARRLQDQPALRAELDQKYSFLSDRRMVLVTGHRRENFGDGFKEICLALQRIAERGDVDVVFPVHLNPSVQGPVYGMLKQSSNIHLLEPVGYLDMVYLLMRCHCVLTDSGGIQEEAPTFGKPVLVMRDTTERPEVIDSGSAILVGSNAQRIVECAHQLLDDAAMYTRMAQSQNPYGDGHSGLAIARRIASHFA